MLSHLSFSFSLPPFMCRMQHWNIKSNLRCVRFICRFHIQFEIVKTWIIGGQIVVKCNIYFYMHQSFHQTDWYSTKLIEFLGIVKFLWNFLEQNCIYLEWNTKKGVEIFVWQWKCKKCCSFILSQSGCF